MTITHKINMDLVSKGIAPKFDMVQGDYCARQIQFHLFANNAPWAIPDGALVMVRYRRPDKSVGVYNTLPDGTGAYSATGNTLSIAVAPEALAIPGAVMLVVSITTREQEVSTFEVQIDVQPNLSSGAAIDGNYSSITGMLPIPEAAVSGQVLVVDEVSNDGKVRTIKAEDFPTYTGQDTPEYVRTEAERLASLVQSRQNANTFSFLVGSDIHARLGYSAGIYNTAQMLTSAKHAAKAMEIIRKQINIDFGAILGDTLWGSGETTDQAMEIFRIVREYFHPAFVGAPQFWVRGNHDYITEDTKLTDDQVFAGISIHNTGVTFDPDHKLIGHCYRDFEAYRLRVICASFPEDGLAFNVSTAQFSWLANALDVSDKGADWKTLILSHVPVNDFKWNATLKNAIVANENAIIANIHGHTHNYQTTIIADTSIPQIGIPAISPYRTKDLEGNEGSAAPYQKVAGTFEDTAFCVVTIDLANQKIYADHYGAGEDRVVDFTSGSVSSIYSVTYNLTNTSSSNAVDRVTSGEAYNTQLTANSGDITSVKVFMGGTDITDTAYSDGSINISQTTGNIVITAVSGGTESGYTNQIPCSTASIDGAEIYNGCGYQTGCRINSSNTEVQLDGMCCTGFIPVQQGDVIRVKNVTLDGAATGYLLLYTHTGSMSDAHGMGVLGDADENGVYTYTIASSGTNVSISAMRLSCGVIDSTSIITVNEEI